MEKIAGALSTLEQRDAQCGAGGREERREGERESVLCKMRRNALVLGGSAFVRTRRGAQCLCLCLWRRVCGVGLIAPHLKCRSEAGVGVTAPGDQRPHTHPSDLSLFSGHIGLLPSALPSQQRKGGVRVISESLRSVVIFLEFLV